MATFSAVLKPFWLWTVIDTLVTSYVVAIDLLFEKPYMFIHLNSVI